MPRKRQGQRMSKPATSCGRPFWCHVTFKRSLTPTLGSRLVFWSTGASHQSDQIGRTPRYGGVTPTSRRQAVSARMTTTEASTCAVLPCPSQNIAPFRFSSSTMALCLEASCPGSSGSHSAHVGHIIPSISGNIGIQSPWRVLSRRLAGPYASATNNPRARNISNMPCHIPP